MIASNTNKILVPREDSRTAYRIKYNFVSEREREEGKGKKEKEGQKEKERKMKENGV